MRQGENRAVMYPGARWIKDFEEEEINYVQCCLQVDWPLYLAVGRVTLT